MYLIFNNFFKFGLYLLDFVEFKSKSLICWVCVLSRSNKFNHLLNNSPFFGGGSDVRYKALSLRILRNKSTFRKLVNLTFTFRKPFNLIFICRKLVNLPFTCRKVANLYFYLSEVSYMLKTYLNGSELNGSELKL